MRALTAKFMDRSILLGATLGLIARQYDLPSKQFWSDAALKHPYVVVALVCTVGVFGALTPFQSCSDRRQVERRVVVRQQVLAHFGKMLTVARSAQLPIETGDLGLHIWQIQRSFRHPLRGYLRCTVTYRLGNTPAIKSFAPTKGVGVVGLCWKRNEEVSLDVQKLASQLTDQLAFENYRAAEGPDAVMGLTWPEFQRVSHRGAVFASPIRSRSGEFIGCVSVDAPCGHDAMDVNDFWHEVNSLCSRIGQDDFDIL